MKKVSYALKIAVPVLIAIIICTVSIFSGCRKDKDVSNNDQANDQATERPEETGSPAESELPVFTQTPPEETPSPATTDEHPEETVTPEPSAECTAASPTEDMQPETPEPTEIPTDSPEPTDDGDIQLPLIPAP